MLTNAVVIEISNIDRRCIKFSTFYGEIAMSIFIWISAVVQHAHQYNLFDKATYGFFLSVLVRKEANIYISISTSTVFFYFLLNVCVIAAAAKKKKD